MFSLVLHLCISGHVSWAEKFASYRKTNISTLQSFSVVLRDESDEFVEEFIQSLGLSHLCRLAARPISNSPRRGKTFSAGFDIELLRVMKAIIDTNEWSLKSLVFCVFDHFSRKFIF